jgi:hypothetical protein
MPATIYWTKVTSCPPVTLRMNSHEQARKEPPEEAPEEVETKDLPDGKP